MITNEKYLVVWWNCWLNNATYDSVGCTDTEAERDEYTTLDEAIDAINAYIEKNPPRFFYDRKNPDGINFVEYETAEVEKFQYDDEYGWSNDGIPVNLAPDQCSTLAGHVEYDEIADMGVEGYAYAAERRIPLDLEMKPYDNDTEDGRYLPFSWPHYVNNNK